MHQDHTIDQEYSKAQELPPQALPGAFGETATFILGHTQRGRFFLPFQRATRNNPPFISISPYIKEAFFDWKEMIQQLKNNPTSIR